MRETSQTVLLYLLTAAIVFVCNKPSVDYDLVIISATYFDSENSGYVETGANARSVQIPGRHNGCPHKRSARIVVEPTARMRFRKSDA